MKKFCSRAASSDFDSSSANDSFVNYICVFMFKNFFKYINFGLRCFVLNLCGFFFCLCVDFIVVLLFKFCSTYFRSRFRFNVDGVVVIIFCVVVFVIFFVCVYFINIFVNFDVVIFWC